MQTVIETATFKATAADIWSAAERDAFIDWIARNAQAGDVIPATGGLRKVRWAAKGHGKRGGARVIYTLLLPHGEVVLITAYSKGDIENVPAHLLRALVEKYLAR